MKKIILSLVVALFAVVGTVNAQKVSSDDLVKQAVTTVFQEKGYSADKQAIVVDLLCKRQAEIKALTALKLPKEERQAKGKEINSKYAKSINLELGANAHKDLYAKVIEIIKASRTKK